MKFKSGMEKTSYLKSVLLKVLKTMGYLTVADYKRICHHYPIEAKDYVIGWRSLYDAHFTTNEYPDDANMVKLYIAKQPSILASSRAKQVDFVGNIPSLGNVHIVDNSIQNDIYVIDLTKYFTRLFELHRPDALDYFKKIECFMYFNISDPTQVQFKYRFYGYRYDRKVLYGLTPDMFVQVVNFFAMLAESAYRLDKELMPEWMFEPKVRWMRGLLKDALDVPQHIEIRRYLFSKGVDVDFDDIVKTDYSSMVDDNDVIPIVRSSLVYWRELGKVLLATNSRFVTADYDDPEVNYDGRD